MRNPYIHRKLDRDNIIFINPLSNKWKGSVSVNVLAITVIPADEILKYQ